MRYTNIVKNFEHPRDIMLRMLPGRRCVMDDDKFKAEVLSRLDRIVSLLSANCSMTKAALERAYPDLMKPKQPPPEQGEGSIARQYQIIDEMQDDYTQAVQKWKSEKGL